jgi:tRNA A37 methylthiotransferase MiaB
MNPRNNNEIVTFGCRLNAFESDVMRRLTAEAGLRDAVIVNTCAVTAEAERQARQAIRRARRYTGEFDADVMEMWCRDETLAHIRGYLDRTVGKK